MEKKENSKGMPENKKISGTNIMESQSVGYKDRWIEYSETPEIFPREAVTSQSSQRNSKAIALSPQVSTRFAVNEAFTMVTEGTEVNYLPKKGYNAEAAYSVQESGNNGQGRVCLATGILNFVYNDVDWNGNRLPVSIFHVFNTPVEGEPENFYPTLYNSGYVTEDAANRTIGMGFGKSWKLNYQQYLYALNESEYVYCDEYGSEYIFKKKETEEGEKVSENLYTDSSEKGYELDIKTNIVKRDGKYYVFDKKSCLLQEIQDESGNKIRIGYEGAAEGERGSEWKIKELTDGVGRVFTFSYNADGTLSTITDAAGKNTAYTYTNGRLTKITRPDGTIDAFSYYVYDNNGEVLGIKYNGTIYLYVKNLQGDVIRMLDRAGKPVVRYVYNAWGKIEKILDGNGRDISGEESHIGNKNPIRYRSYYYDTETELYYLQSRYYDPETCRFINADDVRWILGNENSYNLFSYCGNNPINNIDVLGNAFFTALAGVFSALATAIVAVVAAVIVVGLAVAVVNLLRQLLKELGELIQAVKAKAVRKKTKRGRKVGHHIIAKASIWAVPARRVWVNKLRHNINDGRNMAYIYEGYHYYLHTLAYYQNVNRLITNAYLDRNTFRQNDENVCNVLRNIKSVLQTELG